MFGSGQARGTYRTTRFWRLPPHVVDRTRIRASTRPSRAARTSVHRSIAIATGPPRVRRNRRTARPPISGSRRAPISTPPRHPLDEQADDDLAGALTTPLRNDQEG